MLVGRSRYLSTISLAAPALGVQPPAAVVVAPPGAVVSLRRRGAAVVVAPPLAAVVVAPDELSSSSPQLAAMRAPATRIAGSRSFPAPATRSGHGSACSLFLLVCRSDRWTGRLLGRAGRRALPTGTPGGLAAGTSPLRLGARPAHLEAGEGEGGDEHDAGGELLHPLVDVGQPEPVVQRAEQDDGDDGAPGVEAAVLELRGAEEDGGEGRQQVRLPAVGEPEPMIEASTMPVMPASVADAIRQPNCSRSVRTDASRVASWLKPVA